MQSNNPFPLTYESPEVREAEKNFALSDAVLVYDVSSSVRPGHVRAIDGDRIDVEDGYGQIISVHPYRHWNSDGRYPMRRPVRGFDFPTNG